MVLVLCCGYYVCCGVVLRCGALGGIFVCGIGYCHAVLCVVAWRLVVLCSILCYFVSLFGCLFWGSVSCWRVCCFELFLGVAWCCVVGMLVARYCCVMLRRCVVVCRVVLHGSPVVLWWCARCGVVLRRVVLLRVVLCGVWLCVVSWHAIFCVVVWCCIIACCVLVCS